MALTQPTLKPAQRAVLAQASPDAVVDAAAHIRRYLVAGRWIGTNNRYLRAPIKLMEADAKTGAATASKPKHLREYVAASTVLHAAEGWSYLGRALVSQAAGNVDVARHLGYYAELRAAMAVLATQGIGVFQNSHAILTASGTVRLLKSRGTHPTTWLALEAWADSRVGADAITEVVRPAGVPIGDWIAAFGALASSKPLGRAWLKEWGLDLRRFANDRDARNEVSYRPRVREHPMTSSAVGAEFLHQFWTLFEPSDSEPFGIVDRHLLRCSLDAAFVASPSPTASFRQRLDAALNAQTGQDATSTLGAFLLRAIDPHEPVLITYARERATELNADHPLHVMSRAALLLRLATGLVGSLLKQAAIEFDDVGFWYERVVANHGLTATYNRQDDPIDMWADVRDALQDLGDEINRGGATSYWSLGRTSAPPLVILGGAERIGLWALA